MLKEGYKQVQTAKAIGKNKSVVSRELKRNSDARNNVYKHELALRSMQNVRKKSTSIRDSRL
ncbi:MAG: helix-turn-helix domain-containing protein [Flavobacteriales bacterium]|nr:helix-turn-helix domain-containing protein [Flavobacteriales bacterium]